MNRFLFIALLVVAANSQKFQCPNNKNAQYEDEVQCDKYYECHDGVAREKLCPDGLVFDATIRRLNKCDQPFNVDCGDRTELQPPRGTNEFCPRKNGFFAHPDSTNCDAFFQCVDGEYTENKCAPGLHFDEYSGTCVWPATANREGCHEAKKELKDGFSCPEKAKNDANGQVVAHPHFPHPEDCQKFYVCLNGIEPRELSCGAAEVFNDDIKRCDIPDNVPGCEDWFRDADKN
jgi:hypothetical protein